jgi:hypothetical protein
VLWIATGAALGLFALVLLARSAAWARSVRELPWFVTWGEEPAGLAWLLAFPLWIPALRHLAAVRPESREPYAPGTSRTASLVSRARTSPIGPRHWAFAWGLFAAAAVLVAVRGVGAAGSVTVLSLLLGAVLPLVLTPLCQRLVPPEPEPLDAAGTPELVEAYARIRRRRDQAFYGLALALSVMCAGSAVAVAWGVDARALGWIGAIAGSLVGVAGAVFGVLATNERLRIRALLERLES